MILIVDGNNLAYRARHVFDLSIKGKDISVIYGVLRLLQLMIKKHKPSSIIICWDGGSPAYRKKLIPEYKKRDKSDDVTYANFISQLKELQEAIKYFGILSVRKLKVEADDLMYHASKMLITTEPIVIVTTDDDLYQAIDERVSVLRPGKKEVMVTSENFEELTAVPDPELYVDYKAYQGDGSDNIPGVRGVGPKTAAKIVNLEPISDRIGIKIDAFVESGAFFNAYDTIDLSVDRCGARQALIDTQYFRYRRKEVLDICFKYTFASIVETGLPQTFGMLRKPIISVQGVTPVIWDAERKEVQ